MLFLRLELTREHREKKIKQEEEMISFLLFRTLPPLPQVHDGSLSTESNASDELELNSHNHHFRGLLIPFSK